MSSTALPRRSLVSFGLFLSFLALFTATYFPVAQVEYGVHDEYQDFVSEALDPPEYAIDRESDRGLTPGQAWRRNVPEGRPLNALAKYLTYRRVSELEHHRYVRFMGILGISLLAWSLFRLLVGAGHGRLRAFCVAAAACSTLPFQVWAHWTSTATYPLAAALAGFAFLLADRALSTPPPLQKWLSAGGAGVVLLAALAVFQPAAMFYFVFAAAVLPAPGRSLGDLFRKLGGHCAIAAAALAASYGLAVVGLRLYPMHVDRTALVSLSEVPGQLKWFLLQAFHYAANFALPSPSSLFLPDTGSTVSPETADRIVGWVFFLLVSWGLVLYLRTAGGNGRWKYGAALFLLAVTFLPVLAPEVHSIRYRTLAAPSAILVLYAFFGVEGFARTLRRRSLPGLVMGAAALAGVLSAAYQVRVFLVEPQVREMEFLRGELARSDLSQVRRLYILQPTPEATFAPLRQLEVGRPSSHVRASLQAMVFLVLRETAPAYAHLPVIPVRPHDPLTPLPDSLVLDLRDLGSDSDRDPGGSGSAPASGVPRPESRFGEGAAPDGFRSERTEAGSRAASRRRFGTRRFGSSAG